MLFSRARLLLLIGLLLYGWQVASSSTRGVLLWRNILSKFYIRGNEVEEKFIWETTEKSRLIFCWMYHYYVELLPPFTVFPKQHKAHLRILEVWKSRVLAGAWRGAELHPKTIFLIRWGHTANHTFLQHFYWILFVSALSALTGV